MSGAQDDPQLQRVQVVGDFVTPQHLAAVRGEVHALIGQHRAEVHGQLQEIKALYGALDSKLDASRAAQETESIGLRGALERLTTQVGATAKAVSDMESGDEKAAAVKSALDDFTGKWGRRLIAGIGVLTAVVGALAAVLH